MVVEADHTMDFGTGLLQRLSDDGHGALGDVTNPVLDGVQDGEQGARLVFQGVHFRPDHVRCPVAGVSHGAE